MMTNLLNGAHVANKLFSTIARLRLLLVMFVTLTVSAEVWGASIEINYGSSTTGWTIKDKEWSTKYWGLCNQKAFCIISPNFDDLSVITSVKVTTRTYGNTSNNSNKIGVYANATRIGTQQTATTTFTEYTFTPNDLSGNGAITIQSDGTSTRAGLRVTKVTIEYNDSPKDPCTITYEASLGNPDKTSEETTSSVTLPNISSIDCGDWEFAGWATANIEETNKTPNPLYIAGSTYTPSSDITLYAVYKSTETTSGGGGGGVATGTISFASTAQRTSINTDTQVWVNEGITFTNNKGSGNNVADYSNPIRLYKNSEIVISAPDNIDQIVFTASSNAYATDLATSVGKEATCSSSTVTVTPTTGATSYTITLSAGQTRLNSLTVTYTPDGGGGSSSTTYYHSTPECAAETSR